MPAIIYQKSHGALIPQPNRTVATFSSGLCRVDQTFITTSDKEAFYAQQLAVGNDFPGESWPAIDGLKIFPEIQQIRRGDGFTELKVSAYGRTTNRFNPETIGATVTTNSGLIIGTPRATGRMAIRKSDNLVFEDLDLPFGFNEFTLVEFTLPYLTVTSITKIQDLQPRRFVGWNGQIIFLRLALFQANVFNSQSEITSQFQLVLQTPTISVQSSSYFGEFLELDLIVETRPDESWNPEPEA